MADDSTPLAKAMEQLAGTTEQLAGAKRKLEEYETLVEAQEKVVQQLKKQAAEKRARTQKLHMGVKLYEEMVLEQEQCADGDAEFVLGVEPELYSELKKYVLKNEIEIALVPYPGYDPETEEPDKMLRTKGSALVDAGASYIRGIFMFGVNFDTNDDDGKSYTAHYAFVFEPKSARDGEPDSVGVRLHVRIAKENTKYRETHVDFVYAEKNGSVMQAASEIEMLADNMRLDGADGLASSFLASFAYLVPELTYKSGATISRLLLPHKFENCVRAPRPE